MICFHIKQINLNYPRACLDNSDESIPLILATIFPKFPLNSTDNCSYIQFLRFSHLSCLKSNMIQTIDIINSKQISIPLKVTKMDRSETIVDSPYVYGSQDSKICIASNRYTQAEINVNDGNKNQTDHLLFTQLKPGELNHHLDPTVISVLCILLCVVIFIKIR